MPDQVDATVQRMQASGAKPNLDLVGARSGLEQLPACNHSVLSGGQPRD